MNKTLGWVILLLLLSVGVRYAFPRTVTEKEIVILPAVPETIRVALPAETDTIFIVKRDTVNTVITRFVFDTVLVAAAEFETQRRIVAGVFGQKIGDTTQVVSELMMSVGDSIATAQTTERIYTLGMVGRIGTDLAGATIDWVPFPVERIRECTVWQKIPTFLTGAAAGIILGQIFIGSSEETNIILESDRVDY